MAGEAPPNRIPLAAPLGAFNRTCDSNWGEVQGVGGMILLAQPGVSVPPLSFNI